MLFSEYGYHPHVAGVFRNRKQRFSNTLSRVEIFENGDVSYSCGRAKAEANLGSRFALPHIRFENATCGRRFFKYEGKSLRFPKYPATRGRLNAI